MVVDDFVGTAYWFRYTIYAGVGWLFGGSLVMIYRAFKNFRSLQIPFKLAAATLIVLGLIALVGVLLLVRYLYIGDARASTSDIFIVSVFVLAMIFLSFKGRLLG